MTSKFRKLTRRTAYVTTFVLMLAVPSVSAQELALVNAQPGPEYGERPDNGLSMPTDVAVGIEGRVYVVDSGRHRVVYYDAMGTPLGHFGSEGKDDGQLQGPVGIATGPKGDVYVADRGNQRIQVFDADGKFRSSLEMAEEGETVTPVGIVVSANGKALFVTANNSHRVLAVDRKGKILVGWGVNGKEQGQFKYPATLALDAAGDVLVVDVLNFRVQIFDANGTPTAMFGKLGAKPGTFVRPKGIAVDNAGRIFVSDSYLGVIQVFTPAGEFVGVLSTNGEPARFEAPTGLAFAAGRLFVADMLGNKVLSFNIGGAQ